MIVKRVWPAGTPLAIRSISACIMSEAISFWSPVVLMSSDASTGKGTVAGCVQVRGPKALNSGRDDTPPGTLSSDRAS